MAIYGASDQVGTVIENLKFRPIHFACPGDEGLIPNPCILMAGPNPAIHVF